MTRKSDQMKKISTTFFTILFSIISFAQVDSVSQRIFLVGDAGEMDGNTHPVIDWLKKNVNWNDEKNVLVFLGDNIYPVGLPMEGEPGYNEAKRVLDYQLNVVKGKKSKAYFVPGNHDWKNGKMGGWRQVINQENYINGLGESNIKELPTGGCPGPVAVDISDKVAIVFIDTQWFLYVHEKPGPGSNCDSRTIDEFATQLKEIVATHPNQLLIVATHHPLHTYGAHGGDYTWKEHIFPLTAVNPKLYIPLPILGSIYPIARGVFGNLQDVRHPLYQQMANMIEEVMRLHPNPISVAGHDHNLQFILRDTIPFVVSGSGTHINPIKKSIPKTLLFSDMLNGFSMVEVKKSGNAAVKFYNIKSANLDQSNYTHTLKKIDTIATKISKDSIPIFPDSVLVAANMKLNETPLRNLFMGKNYRAEWTTPIRVPVLDLGKEQGGLTPDKQGGGKQTRSLRLVDKTGKEWALRSVEKFPEAAVPADLRQTIVKDLVEDGISASYPYGGLSVAPFAKAVGIPTLKRKIVFIPDDPRLGRFRQLFKNTLATLEEREPDTIKKTNNTEELVLKLAEDNDRHVDQLQVLKARLLDNFYMDLDRHEGQWQWATRDTGRGKIYYPIPRDQDQVFFINQGIIPRFIKSPWLVPELQGFKDEAANIKTFNRAARNFDRFFLNELSAEEWEKEVDAFLGKMTDVVITTAMLQQPKEIQSLGVPKIINKLKERRKYFKKEMKEYYEFLAKEVNIVGTNQRELFTINKNADGNVQVLINKIDKFNNISTKLYDRVFDPSITRELRIYGLEDADSFIINGGNSPIKIRIIGGPGKDHFANNGTDGNLLVYDVTFEENKFSGNETGLRKRISADPQVNQYNRIFYKYDYFNPGISFAYNVDDGLFVGAKAEIVTNGFRKEPYAMRQYLNVNHAVRTKSYRFRYEADFTKPIGNNDLLIRADIRAPINVTNFFGYGNNTVFNKNSPGREQYYRARYNTANVSFLLRRQLQSWMRVNYGPTLQYFHLEEKENIGKFVNNTAVSGLDPKTMYDRKWYAGAQFLLDINSRNNKVLPTRGFVLDAGARTLFGLGSQTNNITQLHWDMNVIASFGPKAITVYALRLGVATNFGKYEIAQAQYLGGTENLRGFRRNRFAGRTMLYQNTEIRIKVADFNTYLFPGSLGLQLFNDIGKVWVENESSNKWHDGYGIGVWVAPIKRFVVTASIARSKEEKIMPYFSFGFQF